MTSELKQIQLLKFFFVNFASVIFPVQTCKKKTIQNTMTIQMAGYMMHPPFRPLR